MRTQTHDDFGATKGGRTPLYTWRKRALLERARAPHRLRFRGALRHHRLATWAVSVNGGHNRFLFWEFVAEFARFVSAGGGQSRSTWHAQHTRWRAVACKDREGRQHLDPTKLRFISSETTQEQVHSRQPHEDLCAPCMAYDIEVLFGGERTGLRPTTSCAPPTTWGLLGLASSQVAL